MGERLEFIKNIVEVNVDGLKGINHYVIKEAYNKIITDELGPCAKYVEKIIDEFDYKWSDIDKDGGIGKINSDLKECYGEDCF